MLPPYPKKRILIACALALELRAMRACLSEDLQFVCTGLGWKRSRRRLGERVRRQRPAVILFTGTAGQLAPGVEPGHVIFPEKWCFPDGPCFEQSPELTEFLRSRGFSVQGLGVTVPRPVLRADRRIRLHEQSGALVCDMESAGVLAAGRDWQIPTLAVKVVSDAEDSGLSGFWRDLPASLESLGRYLNRMVEVLSSEPAPDERDEAVSL